MYRPGSYRCWSTSRPFNQHYQSSLLYN